MTDTKIEFNVKFSFQNKHFNGDTSIKMTDEVVIIETQDNTKREHTLVIDHDDFKQLISLYQKASTKLNELYDSVEGENELTGAVNIQKINWKKITQENIGLLKDPNITWNDKNTYEPCTKEYVYLNSYSDIVKRVFTHKGVNAIVEDAYHNPITHFALRSEFKEILPKEVNND